MKTVIQYMCLLALFLTGFSLNAQSNCSGPDVVVEGVACDGQFLWTADVTVSQGDSDCSSFIDPLSGNLLDFGTYTFGPFNQQTAFLAISCGVNTPNDSCFTFIQIVAPNNWPCNFSTVCDITFDFAVDTINATCGAADGTASFNLTATADYSIAVTNQELGLTQTLANTPVFSNLSAGFYDYIIFCADGSIAFEGSFAIAASAGFNATIEVDATNCSAPTLTAVTDQAGSYTYAWNTGETTQSITVNGGGNFYSVTVTNENGCSDFAFTQNVPAGITFNFFAGDAICDQENGFIFGQFFGGIPPYTIVWSDGVTDETNRSDLAPGTYTLTITDATGCANSESFEIGIGDLELEVGASLLCDGVATLTAYAWDTSFTEPTTFLWTNPSGAVIGTTQSVTTNEVGVHTVTVDNGEGCTGTQEVTVMAGMASDIEASIEFTSFNDSILGGCSQFLIHTTLSTPNGGWLNSTWQVPGQNSTVWGSSINPDQYGPGLYIATYYPQGLTCPVIDSLVIFAEDLICVNVSGHVYLNLDDDCTLQNVDIDLQYQQLVLSNLSTGNDYYAFTNFNGDYSISLPPGSYSVDLAGNNELLALCSPVGFTLIEGIPISNENVPVVGINDCPRVTVNTQVPLLRRCFDNAVYLNFENTGTVIAEDVVLTVEIGDFASEVVDWFGPTADAIVTDPITGITTATFTIGDLLPFESGVRRLLVYSCSNDFPLGAAGCITATISPNNPCPPADPNWSGASLRVAGACDGQNVNFTVSNVGESDMTAPLSYIVIEDGVLLTPQPQTDTLLPASGTKLFSFPANGSTYHFQIDQEPLHPGLDMPIDFVEGCANGQQVSYGFALQFPVSDDAYWIDEECNELIGAYDPNDKRAMPRGYSDDRYIEAGQMLDYTIRFQNTGTDTAFTVVVRDTLSEVYDLSTLEVTGATHAFRPTVDSSGRALAFLFENIMLVDSFTNEPASHGSVSFRIMAREDLLPGTDVDNDAAIYFDFNEPIFTNDYHLRIEDDFVTVGLFDFNPTVAELKIFPNPTAGLATIQLPKALDNQQLQLEVFDLLGRQQLRYNYGTADLPQLDLSQLPAGWYSIRLTDDSGRNLGAGRVLLQR